MALLGGAPERIEGGLELLLLELGQTQIEIVGAGAHIIFEALDHLTRGVNSLTDSSPFPVERRR